MLELPITGAFHFYRHCGEAAFLIKEITKQSGILSKLEEGDAIMADRGFDSATLLPNGVALNIPPFLGGRDQLEPDEVLATRRIATLSIHVERAIERIKNFRVTHFIPSVLCPLAEHIVVVNLRVTSLDQIFVQYGTKSPGFYGKLNTSTSKLSIKAANCLVPHFLLPILAVYQVSIW